MDAINPMFKKPKERKKHLFQPPSYCKRDYPCIPLDADCLPVPLKLEVSDPSKIMYFLENFSGVTSKELEFDINTYLKHECEAEDVFVIHLMRSSEQARVQMVTERVLEIEIVHPIPDKQIVKLIKFDGANYICNEPLEPEVLKIVKKALDNKGNRVLVVPVVCKCRRQRDDDLRVHGNPVLLVCLTDCNQTEFFVSRCVQELFRYILTTLLNTIECEEQARLKKNCYQVLDGSKDIFLHIHDLNDLLRQIMLQAKLLTNAERCSLYLLDYEHLNLVSRVFNIDAEEAHMEVKIARDQGIAGYVAATGITLNIKTPYEHPLFNKAIDKMTGYKTRNILCFPIRDENGIIGVAQLTNKLLGNFDKFDEEAVEAFSIYCGISFMHSLTSHNMQNVATRTQLVNNLLLNNIKVELEDIAQVMCCRGVHKLTDFDSFEFLPFSILDKETVCMVIKMFDDLNFINKYNMRKEVMINFFLYIKKSYRDLAFHNWKHAFCSGHFIYVCLTKLKLVEKQYITPIEALALLISAFCYNVDHRGNFSIFHLHSGSLLSNLYSSEHSTAEKHSLSQTLITLQLEGCNFLEGLSETDYKLCISLIKDMILATDMASHFKLLTKQKKICVDSYQNYLAHHRYYLCALFMTASTISDLTKNWLHTKIVARYIYEEFFRLGDLEKELGRKTFDHMDRSVSSIPDVQTRFLKEICLPVFEILSEIFSECIPLKEAIELNTLYWERTKQYFQEQMADGKKIPFEVLQSHELEDEINNIKEALRQEAEEDAAGRETIVEVRGEEETEETSDHENQYEPPPPPPPI